MLSLVVFPGDSPRKLYAGGSRAQCHVPNRRLTPVEPLTYRDWNNPFYYYMELFGQELPKEAPVYNEEGERE